ncbi:MAG: beta-lactamase domain protein [Bacillales bacterium]|jgi:glyoxylase-like metal-dependent hydrolase (beta-lactamase superfamily II)|nr:beta-lactamase domain protein [Bacillales bacterium]
MLNVKVLNIEYKFNDIKETFHPVIIFSGEEIIMIDCGYPGFLSIIEREIQKIGVDCNMINKIMITHQDHDHMGSLADFIEKYPKIQVIASNYEAPYVAGDKKSLRLLQAEEFQKTLPEEQKEFGEHFCEILRNVRPCNVDITVDNGDFIDINGECKVIATPGHTPGHISLYLKKIKTIITGDAAVLENNKLVIANPQFTLDFKQAEDSLEKILSYDANTFICYHGGVYKSPN